MTKQEVKQQAKFTALNEIRKIYNPKHEVIYSKYEDDGSYAEQRDSMIERIIYNLEEELKNINRNPKLI